ncbi:hypothetical protein PYCCODRAFT_909511 [Trametes coccinea BRFM310]|uniref:Fungal-type protein kinase domain-containing protein n=1 Tax=Trametes coccinea (strain BRFM310) TaxID=1353009 RepID=A0A1Y2ICP7_TRAC3|nr:hypothetical protein PYCCODRAFT_909511 [Trametes coccinea BRFM310]
MSSSSGYSSEPSTSVPCNVPQTSTEDSETRILPQIPSSSGERKNAVPTTGTDQRPYALTELDDDEAAHGWDPIIVCVPEAERDSRFICQYDIGAFRRLSSNGQRTHDRKEEIVVYRTERLLSSQVAANDGYGRGAKVWTARRLAKGSQATQSQVVIKVAIGCQQREGDTVSTLPTGLKSVESLDERARPGFTIQSSYDYQVSMLQPRTQHRITVHEGGHPLHEESCLLTAFTVIRDIMRSLCFLQGLGWVHRDTSTGKILVVDDTKGSTRGLLTEFEYAQHIETDLCHFRTTHPGTEYFTSIEVSYQIYFWKSPCCPRTALPVTSSPQTVLSWILTGESDMFLTMSMPDDIQDDCPPDLPFHYHLLNDWESLWWVSLYMVTDRIIKPAGNRTFRKQEKIARALFSDLRSRMQAFREGMMDEKLSSCVDPQIRPIVELLLRLRKMLVNAYREVEADPTQHPNPARSLRLVLSIFPPVLNEICKYLEAHPELHVEPFPRLW